MFNFILTYNQLSKNFFFYQKTRIQQYVLKTLTNFYYIVSLIATISYYSCSVAEDKT